MDSSNTKGASRNEGSAQKTDCLKLRRIDIIKNLQVTANVGLLGSGIFGMNGRK